MVPIVSHCFFINESVNYVTGADSDLSPAGPQDLILTTTEHVSGIHINEVSYKSPPPPPPPVPNNIDKVISWSSYLQNGISYTGTMASLYWIRPMCPLVEQWH